jgi:hypothetical protein
MLPMAPVLEISWQVKGQKAKVKGEGKGSGRGQVEVYEYRSRIRVLWIAAVSECSECVTRSHRRR